MNDNTVALFSDIDLEEMEQLSRASKRTPEAEPRLRRPDRTQVLLRPLCLDELLPPDHDARIICAVVKRLDLSAFYKPLQARGSDPGRAATDPALLVTLWLYATMNGMGRGRELARLCESHDAYRWICGGVRVNYHTLNDFRVGFEKELDELFTQVLALLVHHGVVTVERISQDGTRVRASAGSSSFRSEEALEKRVAEMQAHVDALKTQLEAPDTEDSARKQAAQQRAAQDRLSRAAAALKELPKIAQAKAKQKNKPSKHREARVSTTDAEARFMKMPGGGSRPAYNVQLAADIESRAIVGVEVTNAGSDVNESEPMRKQVEQRTGQKVEEHLMDGGYVGLESIDRASKEGVTIYAPVPKPRKAANPYEPRKGDTPGVAAWRRRMGTEEAKAIYKERASTVETVNGDLKCWRGLGPFVVRGLRKVRCIALWSALAYNVMHFTEVLVR
jgi:transposase